jgi:para-nitrobenzyl esterase
MTVVATGAGKVRGTYADGVHAFRGIPYALDSPIGSALYGKAPAADEVSREMSTAWRAFATNGDPGWPGYDPVEQLTRVFDAEPRTMRYPEQAPQRIWADYPFDPFPMNDR